MTVLKMNHLPSRKKLAIGVSALIFSCALFATLVMPLFVSQSEIIIYSGWAVVVLMGVTGLFLYRMPWRRYSPYLVLFTTWAVLTSLIAISGGVNSQFAPLLPLVPLALSLIGDSRKTLIGSLLFIVTLFALYFAHGQLTDVTRDVGHVNMAHLTVRLFWLVMAISIGTAFAVYFERQSRKLGTRLQEQASKDVLTGLDNRRSVLARLDDAIEDANARRQWLSVLILDIDYFKSINDNYGHGVGDDCLKSVAHTLKLQLRSKDDMLGRYGGEEFIVVLKDVDQTITHRVAEKLRQSVSEQPVITSHSTFSVTATVGYCCLQGGGISSKEFLIHAADEALRAGKNKGRNTVVGAEQALLTDLAMDHV